MVFDKKIKLIEIDLNLIRLAYVGVFLTGGLQRMKKKIHIKINCQHFVNHNFEADEGGWLVCITFLCSLGCARKKLRRII